VRTARPNQSGQATIELALLLPTVFLLASGIVFVGVLGSDHVRVWHAAREAARVAVVDDDPGEVRAAAERGGLQGLEIAIAPPPEDRVRGEPLTVDIAYRPVARIPLVGLLLDGIEMTASATMRIEEP
jgi:TadE-like protein